MTWFHSQIHKSASVAAFETTEPWALNWVPFSFYESVSVAALSVYESASVAAIPNLWALGTQLGFTLSYMSASVAALLTARPWALDWVSLSLSAAVLWINYPGTVTLLHPSYLTPTLHIGVKSICFKAALDPDVLNETLLLIKQYTQGFS